MSPESGSPPSGFDECRTSCGACIEKCDAEGTEKAGTCAEECRKCVGECEAIERQVDVLQHEFSGPNPTTASS